jgi:Glycosyl transferase family 64 domain
MMHPVATTYAGGKTSNKRLRYSQSMSAIIESREDSYDDTVPVVVVPSSSSSHNFGSFDHSTHSHHHYPTLASLQQQHQQQQEQPQAVLPFQMPWPPRKRRIAPTDHLISFVSTLSVIKMKQKRPSSLVVVIFLVLSFLCLSNMVLPMQLYPSSSGVDHPQASSTPNLVGTLSSVVVGASTPLIRPISHSIPLPLPKEKVSVVLMNFSRPRMIRDSSMMRTLLSHPNVDEVLLLHANPKTAFEFVHPKVVNIDAIEYNDEMGLSLRFYFCQLAKNDWVVHIDDDMEFTPAALNELFIEFGRNPRRVVGRFGRDLTPGNSFNGYNSKDSHKSSEVVLTKLMVMERDICGAFFEYAHLVWDDVVLREAEGPLWNGEDIFMSLVANHVYGAPADGRKFNNYAMDWLDVWQADDSLKDYVGGKLDISGGMRGYRFWDWVWWQTLLRRNRHYSYRGNLWVTAKDRLAAINDIPKSQQQQQPQQY